MVTGIKLNEYDATPLYNIKAVVQATDISPSTLRAWERRYNVCNPSRSDSGYRLYSDRDVAVIRWLKTQVDAGMAISQAVAWMDSITEKAEEPDGVFLPMRNGQAVSTQAVHSASVPAASQPMDFTNLQNSLLESLLHYEDEQAESVLTEAFARYPVEQVGEQLLTPVLTEIGRRWHDGELSITAEHFATSYIRQRLSVLLRAAPAPKAGPIIWTGCAPGELHEIAVQMITLYLRRAGYWVQYLGQNIHTDDLISEIEKRKPAMVILSANSPETASKLGELAQKLAAMPDPVRPLFGYGGMIFNAMPQLRTHIPGSFLGSTTREAVDVVNQLLSSVPVSTG